MEKVIKSAIVGITALAAAGTLVTPTTALAAAQEKCYGIVKAGMNDCETATAACAGSAKRNAQPDAYIFLPKGVCNKIVGGSLKPKT